MNRCLGDTSSCVPLKNILSEELSHMRPSLIPLLLSGMEQNMRDFDDLKLFECEKVFIRNSADVQEYYELSFVLHQKKSENLYYSVVQEFEDIVHKLQIPKYELRETLLAPSFAHSGRVAEIVVRGQVV